MSLIFFGLLGLLVGIFINRGADNLPPPARRALWQSPHCPYCETPRTSIEQVGILSFALRRDKCHSCAAPLGLRVPLVELGCALLYGFLASRYSVGLYLVAILLFTALLLLIVVIDVEHKLILNVVVLPATLVALVLSPILLTGPEVTAETLNLRVAVLAVLGAVVGYALTYLIYLLGMLFIKFVNRRRAVKINTVAFGMGDVKLAGMLGALVGFPAIFYVLFYAILLGGVGAVVTIVWQALNRRGYSRFMAIPYGPFLVLAGWVTLIWR